MSRMHQNKEISNLKVWIDDTTFGMYIINSYIAYILYTILAKKDGVPKTNILKVFSI